MILKLKKLDIDDKPIIKQMISEALTDSWAGEFNNYSFTNICLERSGEAVCDLVGIDDKKRLILVFIDTSNTEQTLSKLITSFDWVKENQKLIGMAYSEFSVNIDLGPHIIIFSNAFSVEFIKALSYLEIPKISAYKYICIETEGKDGMILEKIDLPVKKTLYQKDNAIKNENKRQTCLKCFGLTREEEKDILSLYNGIVSF